MPHAHNYYLQSVQLQTKFHEKLIYPCTVQYQVNNLEFLSLEQKQHFRVKVVVQKADFLCPYTYQISIQWKKSPKAS